MGKAALAVVVVAILCISGIGAFALTKEYNITYDLDEGINSPDNPSKYKIISSIELQRPTKEGYIFTGWYTDEDLTKEITKISIGTHGDLKLFAGWEKSLVGTQYVFDIEGTTTSSVSIFSQKTLITGTISYSYLYYDYDLGYYMEYDQTITKKMGYHSTTSTDSDNYWTSENSTMTWSQGNDTTINTNFGPMECEVWIGTDGGSATETQYIGISDNVVYLIEYRNMGMGSATSITYTLTATNAIDVHEDYTVTAYSDVGITVSGNTGVVDAYTTVTLTAKNDGKVFGGWYSETGELLSTSATYTIKTLLSDVTVYALNNSSPDISSETQTVTYTPTKSLTDTEWTFIDGEVKTVKSTSFNYTFSEPGDYTVTYTGKQTDGKTYYGLITVFCDGYVNREFSWSYNFTKYKCDIDIKYSDYLNYKNNSISRCQGTAAHDLEFVTYNDPYVIELANKIYNKCSTLSDLDKANVLLTFTQNIEYMYDIDSVGKEEYWKFPVETLYDQNGDCEDTSILFCALAKAMSVNKLLTNESAMLLFSGHMAAAINVSGASGSSFVTTDGYTVYYCETTSTGWKVGQAPDGYSSSTVKSVIHVV